MEKKRDQTGIYPSPESRDVVEKKRAERVLAHPPGSDRNPNVGGPGMAENSPYYDSAKADNQEKSESWQHVGVVAKRIVEKAERK